MNDLPTRRYAAQSHYYVQGHPATTDDLFGDERDFAMFMSLTKRYLRSVCRGRLELAAYCLTPRDFYFCFYQEDAGALPQFMRLLSAAYDDYFRRRYAHDSPLKRQHYRASRVTRTTHLLPLSRYIHRQPADYLACPWSSLPYYLGERQEDGLRPATGALRSPDYYRRFVAAGQPVMKSQA